MRHGLPRLRTAAATTAALVALLLAGCSSPQAEPAVSPTPAPQGTAVPGEGEEPGVEPWTSFVATALEEDVEVFEAPAEGTATLTVTSEEVTSLPGEIPLTFLVIEQRPDWVNVYLPVRPNGSTGWLRAQDVAITSTDFKVEVRITEHRLLLHQAGEVVMDVPVGVGRDEVPTPGGVYYLKELLQPPDQDGLYGAFAYGLSGYSPVLESFAGGQGVIGIHGTNEPESVGTDASHGCIRMYNEDVIRLVEEFGLPLGTPVEIVA